MLSSTSPREALLACHRFPPWNLPSFTVESTLSSSCSRCDSPLFRQGAALAHLDSLPPLMIWCSEPTALFLFLLTKAALAYLPIVLSVAFRPLLLFQQAQYALVFPLKSAPFCTLFAGLGSTNKSVTFLFSSYLTLVLSLPPCSFLHLFFYLNLSSRSGRNLLHSPPVLSGYNGSPNPRFSRGTTRLMSWPDGEHYLRLHQSLVVSLSLISRIHSYLFSDWRRTVSSKFFDTQIPSIATDELVLPRHASYVFSRLRCNGNSLLLSSCLSRIGRIENSCSACGHSFQDTSHLILQCPELRTLCAADSLATLCLSTIFGPGSSELPGFWCSMVFRHAPISRKGSGNQQQQQQTVEGICSWRRRGLENFLHHC